MSNENETNADDGRLNRFLTELVNLQDNTLLQEGDVNTLLDKYELSPEDLDKLAMLIERHINRALDYKSKERWDSAIVETERALLFAPLNNEIRLDLAELFLKRSIQFGYLQKDLDRADREIKDALILEPENKSARKFQKEMKQLRQMLKGTQHNRRIIPFAILVILVLAAALYPQVRKRFAFLSLDTDQQQSSEIPAAPPPWESRELEYTETSSLNEDFQMDLVEATLVRESASGPPAVSVAGYMEALNDDYINLEIELFRSDDNSSLGRIPIVKEGDAPLMMGEIQSFYDYMYLNDNVDHLKSVYIGISAQDVYRAQEDRNWREETLHNSKPLPNGVFLSAESRFVNQIEGYDRNYFFYDLRIGNKGNTPLSKLNLTVQWRDKDNTVLSEQRLSFTEHDALPVRGQTLQTERVMFNLAENRTGGTINVLLKDVEKK
ncbi:MAG: hypothetical protein PQJ58_02710 [Spirochaetales bacterium]|nr:hypothetical protein [Spirochaetales bacterium]